MRNLALFIFIALAFASCAKSPQSSAPKPQSYKQLDLSNSLEYQALQAYDALGNEDNQRALDLFYEIYKSTKSNLCAKEAFRLAFLLEDERVDELLGTLNEISKHDNDALRLVIGYYITKSNLTKAKSLALKLLKTQPNYPANHSILGTIYALQDNKAAALESFKKAYELDPSEMNVLKLFDMLENGMSRRNEAIKYLDDWASKYGCTKQTCLILLGMHVMQDNTNKVVSTYTKLYEALGDTRFLRDGLSLLIYKKDFKGAQRLLEQYHFDDDALVEVYASLGLFDKAYKLCESLYEKNENPAYLSKMAMYSYEKNTKNTSRAELMRIAELFEKSVYEANEAVYYNYYGYLLIDHDIDIKKGLELVLKAHELSPSSNYIIDSVAWGYYKLGDCKSAKEWMDKVAGDAEFMEQIESKTHKIAIDKCLLKGAK